MIVRIELNLIVVGFFHLLKEFVDAFSELIEKVSDRIDL